ncbi:uncharacterized protein LOC118200706 [Stegodyphus dumicola]|uniref:uncharacterized protein LOC118200706 n=1 Tax=Stegodyphus dumicola TaxID=202533 RepID=UPI0015AD47CF|nr:uncharacterized protein LOC118200706 [Stegodyphus dumicola]
MVRKKNAQLQTGLRRMLLNVIRKLQGTKGATLRDLKSYFFDSAMRLKLFLKSALDCGILSKLYGHYKVMESGRRRRSSRRRRRGRGPKLEGAPKGHRRRRRNACPKRGKSRRRKSCGRRKLRRRVLLW